MSLADASGYPDASPLAQRVLGLYVFLHAALTEAQLSRDRQKLAHVRRVLQSERETWQQVCQQLADSPAGENQQAEILATPPVTPAAALSLEA